MTAPEAPAYPCFAASLRLIWIDAFVSEGHDLNRRDLVQAFGISVQQARLDLSEFRRLWPWRLAYQSDNQRYVAAPGGAPVFAQGLRRLVLTAAVEVKGARSARGWV